MMTSKAFIFTKKVQILYVAMVVNPHSSSKAFCFCASDDLKKKL